jgi:hypothetical protein
MEAFKQSRLFMIMLCIKKAKDLRLAAHNNKKCQPTGRVMTKSYLFVLVVFFESLGQICRSA